MISGEQDSRCPPRPSFLITATAVLSSRLFALAPAGLINFAIAVYATATPFAKAAEASSRSQAHLGAEPSGSA